MTRRRLFRDDVYVEADVRPTLLGIVTLMFLLLFFLLSTSSGVRLGVIGLRFAASGDLAALPHAGLVKEVTLRLRGPDAELSFDVATTDIAASATSVERRVVVVPAVDGAVDVPALDAAVRRVWEIDRSQTRARLVPDPATTTDTLFAVMDVLRGGPGAPVFPELTLDVTGGS